MKNKEKAHKIKLVIIIQSELAQRWLDFFCLDKLNEAFDLEYWDCSDFVLEGIHFDTIIERDYVHKIHNLWDFWTNLRRLPKDALISNHVHFSKYNFWCHILLSHYFPKINYLNFYANTFVSGGKAALMKNGQNDNIYAHQSYKMSSVNRVNELKELVYKMKRVRFAIKYILHPDSVYRSNLMVQYMHGRYHMHEISCAVGSEYKINHPDVEAFLKAKDRPVQYQGRYMVYLDQFFPLHPDFREQMPNVDVYKLASDFYLSLNAFFSKLEEEYQCRIIIAAHPLSDYKENPFDNREMVHYNTVELVKGSIGVLTQNSNAISYAMLFRKPLALLSNSQLKMLPVFYRAILDRVERFNFPLINMDEESDIEIHQLPDDVYDDYIRTYFGDIDESGNARNENLLIKHLNSVWHDMYDDVQ